MATKTGNPFLDQNFAEIFDFKKYADNLRMPNMDSKALMDAQRKNIEAMTQANRIAFEGMQAVAQRQSEIVRQTMEETVEVMKQMNSAGTPEERVAKQTEAAKKAFENTMKNAKELAEMSSKSNNEAMELIQKRFTEGFDEMRESLQSIVKTTQEAANTAAPASAPAKKSAA